MLSILLGAILLLTGTILGWVAVVRIRRSEGQLYGLRLALFAGLLLPLILLDLLIFVGLVLLARAFAGAMDWAELLILAIVVCPLVDYWIVRKVWRLLTGSPDKSDSPSTSEPDKPGTFATLAIGFGFLSGLIPTLFYWLRPLHGDWLTDSTVEFMLWLTLAAALLAVALGWWTRASRRGRNGLIVGGISLTIWVLFFVAGQVSERGTTRAVTTLTENEAQATVELVENETRFGGTHLKWEVKPNRPVNFTGGWYAVENGRLVAHGSPPSAIDPTSEPFKLVWEYRKDENELDCGASIGGVSLRWKEELPTDVSWRTRTANDATLKSDKYTELWRGTLIRYDGNVEITGRSYVFVARLLGSSDKPGVTRLGDDIRSGRLEKELELEPEIWAGTYRNESGANKTLQQIIGYRQNYSWDPTPAGSTSDIIGLTQKAGGLEMDGSAERLRFTQVEEGVRLEKWAKATGEKVVDTVLERVTLGEAKNDSAAESRKEASQQKVTAVETDSSIGATTSISPPARITSFSKSGGMSQRNGQWRVDPARPVRIIHGWYAIEDHQIVGKGASLHHQEPVSEPFNLYLEHGLQFDPEGRVDTSGAPDKYMFISSGRDFENKPQIVTTTGIKRPNADVQWAFNEKSNLALSEDHYTELWRANFLAPRTEEERASDYREPKKVIRSYRYVVRIARPDEADIEDPFSRDIEAGRVIAYKGPVIERVITEAQLEKHNVGLDLETGISGKDSFGRHMIPDLEFDYRGEREWFTFDMAFKEIDVTSLSGSSLDAADAAKLPAPDPKEKTLIRCRSMLFRTKEGNSGILQIVPQGSGFLLRYRFFLNEENNDVIYTTASAEEASAHPKIKSVESDPDFESKPWEGIYRGKLGIHDVLWQIVKRGGDFYWLEKPDGDISNEDPMISKGGGFEAEDGAERFRFTQVDRGLRFEIWRKKSGEKVADIVLERVKSDDSKEDSDEEAIKQSDTGLQFRIAPQASELSESDLASYRDQLERGQTGFWWKGQKFPSYVPQYAWLPISKHFASPGNPIIGEHGGKRYLLVSGRAGEKMLPGEGKEAWQVVDASVQVSNYSPDSYRINVELDKEGGNRFEALTKANLRRAIAIIVDGEVVSAPTVQSVLSRNLQINGSFSKEEAEQLKAALVSGEIGETTMQGTLRDFLESCAEKNIETIEQMNEALGFAEFNKNFGDGERVYREHHAQLPEIMQVALSPETGAPVQAFFEQLFFLRENGPPEIKEQAALMGQILGLPAVVKKAHEKSEISSTAGPDEIVAMIDPLKGLFAAIYIAVVEKEDAQAGLKAYQAAEAQFENFREMLKGSPMAAPIGSALEQIEAAAAALKEGDLTTAQSLLEGLDRVGPQMEIALREAQAAAAANRALLAAKKAASADQKKKSQPLRFVPDPEQAGRSSWSVLPKGSVLHPEGWAILARLAMNGKIRVTQPGDEDPFLEVHLVDGDDSWIQLKIRDLVGSGVMSLSLPRGQSGSILTDGKGYRVLFPKTAIGIDEEGETPFAQVMIFEEGAGVNKTRVRIKTLANDLEKVVEIWTCSNHPVVKTPAPGDCPICNTALEQFSEADNSESMPPYVGAWSYFRDDGRKKFLIVQSNGFGKLYRADGSSPGDGNECWFKKRGDRYIALAGDKKGPVFEVSFPGQDGRFIELKKVANDSSASASKSSVLLGRRLHYNNAILGSWRSTEFTGTAGENFIQISLELRANGRFALMTEGPNSVPLIQGIYTVDGNLIELLGGKADLSYIKSVRYEDGTIRLAIEDGVAVLEKDQSTEAPDPNLTREQVARAFMEALRDGEIDAAMRYVKPELKKNDPEIRYEIKNLSAMVTELYADRLGLLTQFTKWIPKQKTWNYEYLLGLRAATRIAGPSRGEGYPEGVYLILEKTVEGWFVDFADGIPENRTLESIFLLKERSPITVEWARQQPVKVSLPTHISHDEYHALEKMKQIVEGLTWSDFLKGVSEAAMTPSWNRVLDEDGSVVFEVIFLLGGDRVQLDLALKDGELAFSRLFPVERPEEVVTGTDEYFPMLIMRYGAKTGHPEAKVVMDRARDKAAHLFNLSQLRNAVNALTTYYQDKKAFPAKFEELAANHYINKPLELKHPVTGETVDPIYHGYPELDMGKVDITRFIILATPAPDGEDKRLVACLDGHVEHIAEEEYQNRIKAQAKARGANEARKQSREERAGSSWLTLDKPLTEFAVDYKGKNLLVFYAADWCVACGAMKEHLRSDEFVELLNRTDLVVAIADCTKSDSIGARELNRIGPERYSVPALSMIRRDGTVAHAALEVSSKEQFKATLQALIGEADELSPAGDEVESVRPEKEYLDRIAAQTKARAGTPAPELARIRQSDDRKLMLNFRNAEGHTVKLYSNERPKGEWPDYTQERTMILEVKQKAASVGDGLSDFLHVNCGGERLMQISYGAGSEVKLQRPEQLQAGVPVWIVGKVISGDGSERSLELTMELPSQMPGREVEVPDWPRIPGEANEVSPAGEEVQSAHAEKEYLDRIATQTKERSGTLAPELARIRQSDDRKLMLNFRNAEGHPEVLRTNGFVTTGGNYSFGNGTRELKISVEKDLVTFRVRFLSDNGYTSSTKSMELTEGSHDWFAYVDGNQVWLYNGKSHFVVLRKGVAQTESGEIPTTGVYALDRALLDEVPEAVKRRIPDLVLKIEQGEQDAALKEQP